jgi:hypothetical protein
VQTTYGHYTKHCHSFGTSVAKPSGDYIPLGFVFGQGDQPPMPPRVQRLVWRFLDNALPEGPAFFLTFVVVFLLFANVLILLVR